MTVHSWSLELAKSIRVLLQNDGVYDYLIPNRIPPISRRPAVVVDVGGSTLRVAKVDSFTVEHIHLELIPDTARYNPLEWIASKISLLEIGEFALCWAFPLKDGVTQPMGKGWHLPAADLGKNLQDQLNKKLNRKLCRVVAHDAFASLVAHHAADSDCNMALTWGTGVNIAFIAGPNIINSELGMAGIPPYGPEIPSLPCDVLLRQQVPGNMPFEYITGGAYLGQLYTLATGIATRTDDLWQLSGSDTVADLIIDRACEYVAGAVYAIANVVGCSDEFVVAYTGGVIFQQVVLERLCSALDNLEFEFGFKIRLEPQKYGPEVGAALLFPNGK